MNIKDYNPLRKDYLFFKIMLKEVDQIIKETV